MSDIGRFFKVFLPGIGYKEKTEHIRLKTEYQLARQHSASIGLEFRQRTRFRGGLAFVCIVMVALAWCVVFVLGQSVSAKPFQLLLNIVSSKVMAAEKAAASAERSAAGESLTSPAATGSTASAVSTQPTTPSAPTASATSTQPATTAATTVTVGPSTTLASIFEKMRPAPVAPPADPPADPSAAAAAKAAGEKLDIDRVTNFIGYLYQGNLSTGEERVHLIFAVVILLLTSLQTNMLILACLAAVSGALCNYAVQALKQSREVLAQSMRMAASHEPGAAQQTQAPSLRANSFGHRRVFSSLSATCVTGVSLGFAAFLACSAGFLIFPQFVRQDSPEGYQVAVCTASFLAFVVALFPDSALLFIENRVNKASNLAVAARQQRADIERGESTPVGSTTARTVKVDPSPNQTPETAGHSAQHVEVKIDTQTSHTPAAQS